MSCPLNIFQTVRDGHRRGALAGFSLELAGLHKQSSQGGSITTTSPLGEKVGCIFLSNTLTASFGLRIHSAVGH